MPVCLSPPWLLKRYMKSFYHQPCGLKATHTVQFNQSTCCQQQLREHKQNTLLIGILLKPVLWSKIDGTKIVVSMLPIQPQWRCGYVNHHESGSDDCILYTHNHNVQGFHLHLNAVVTPKSIRGSGLPQISPLLLIQEYLNSLSWYLNIQKNTSTLNMLTLCQNYSLNITIYCD